MSVENNYKIYNVGDKFTDKLGRVLKIMAFVDNWYMLRFKGCIPFCKHYKDFYTEIELGKITPLTTDTKSLTKED